MPTTPWWKTHRGQPRLTLIALEHCDLNPGPGIGASAWHVEIDGCGLLMDSGTHPKREERDTLPLYDAVRERPVDTIAITTAITTTSARSQSRSGISPAPT